MVPRSQGMPHRSFASADEVVLTIRGSKTDQLNEGNVKNHFRADGELCVVEALQHVQSRAPERWPHSLRFGGASALWAAYRDSAVVKRWGRWASEAFQGYLWEARGNAAGVATAMASADLTQIRH